MQKNQTSKSVLRALSKGKRINELVLCPTSGCNLNCRHCSFHIKSDPKEQVSVARLCETIDEAIVLGVKLFVLVAKEPLLDIDRTCAILDHLKKRKACFGMVTNGTLVEMNIDRLRQYQFSYLDISIDGTKEFHDATRGEGNYERALSGIKAVLQHRIAERFFISSTIMSFNYQNLPSMIDELMKMGVRNFSLGVYIYTGRNPEEWILKEEQLAWLLEELKKPCAEQILLDIHAGVAEHWAALVRKGVIREEQVKTDEQNNVYYHIPGTKIFLKNSLFTTTFWNTAILTADGYYLDDYEHFSNPDYKATALGNVKTESLKELFAKAAAEGPGRFKKKISSHPLLTLRVPE